MKKQAFTLVELIVVITILAVLGTIAFVSFQGYAQSSRDSVRISDLRVIQKALEFELTKNDILPSPDNSITLTASGTIIGYQGYAGIGALGKIGISDKVIDPKDNTEYTYSTNQSKTKYQLLGFLEAELSSIGSIQVFADFTKRIPTTKGSDLGILIDESTNTPIQDGGVDIDIQNTTISYGLLLNKGEKKYIGDSDKLYSLLSHRTGVESSCLSIIESGKSKGDGIYSINPQGQGAFDVYCDMTNGGWMLVLKAVKGGHDYFISEKLGSVVLDNDFDSINTYKISDQKIRLLKEGTALFKIELFDNTFSLENYVYVELEDITAYDSTVRSSKWSNTNMKGSKILSDIATLPNNPARDWPDTCQSAYGPNKGYSACHNPVHIGYKNCSARGFGIGASCANNGTWQNERAGKMWIQ